jgi:hypothetical protein
MGAAAGSVVPGVGTAIGAGAGAIIGAGISIFGSIESGNDQNQIDQEKAANEVAQAQQVAAREAANDALRQQALITNQMNVSSEQAASGHETAGIGSQLELKRQNDIQTQLNDQAATFQENQLLSGASMTEQAGSQAQTAGYLQAAGTGVSALGTVLNPKSGIINYGSTSALPALPAGYGN